MRHVRQGLLLSLVVTSLAWAAQPAPKRIAALVVPMDKSAEQTVLRIETYANEALGEYEGFSVKTSDELFAVSADDEAAAALKRADGLFVEGRTAFDGRNWDESSKKLRAALKEYDKAVAAMKGCGNLCETIAMYATVLQAKGDSEEAKLVLLDLLSLAPTAELDRKRYPQTFLSLKAQVATSRNAQLRGNINVKSRPSGARVYLDGDLMGYTPMTLQTLAIGKHLVRVERPGFRQVGQMVEVAPEDQEVNAELTATSAYKAYDGLMDKLAGEAIKDKGGATMSAVANSLKLDRAIVGMLRDVDGQTELTLGYFDLKAGRRFSIKRATFQGDEFGQLRGEVSRMVTSLLNYDGAEKVTHTSDPLDSHHGTEDWNADDKGGRNKKRDKNKAGDPLEGRSGTEDW